MAVRFGKKREGFLHPLRDILHQTFGVRIAREGRHPTSAFEQAWRSKQKRAYTRDTGGHDSRGSTNQIRYSQGVPSLRWHPVMEQADKLTMPAAGVMYMHKATHTWTLPADSWRRLP